MTDLALLDATATADLVRTGEVSAAEAVERAITDIEKHDPELNAVIHPLFDRARATLDAGVPDGPFRGVPIVVKDLDGSLAGAPLHAGNRALRDAGYVPEVTSYLFERLEQAGFVVVGKTNTPEFGLQPTAEPLSHGPTRNPWSTAHSPGGSSGGSAAAVAAGLVPVGHAGDGGGSIRIPAAHCGLFGLKPSRGRVSLGPTEGESWSGLVTRHVVTRSVRDSAAVLDVIAGPMPGDPYGAPTPARPYTHEVGAEPGRLRIGLHTRAPAGMAETAPENVAAAEDAASLLESLGHRVEMAAPPALDEDGLLERFMAIVTTSVLGWLDQVGAWIGRAVGPDDVEPLTWAYAEMGRPLAAVTYVEGLAWAQAWTRRMASWWHDDGFDLLLTPTCAEPPPVLGDLVPPADDPFQGAARATPFATYTAPFNVTGQPAMSVPLASSPTNLPLGVQLVASHYREDLLLQLAGQLELARPWADRRPVVHA